MDETRPPTLAPTEAYAAIEAFAALRGETALRLAAHAALPQVLRAELLHGLRLNFAEDTLGDAAIEADLLFAPFARPLGHGAVAFDAEVRAQLLKLLDALHPDQAPPRSVLVADFVLAWLDRERSRARADADRLYAGWIEAERWNALAFVDPEAAAGRLAAAVAGTASGAGSTVRLRVGALAATLSTPLVAHARLLRYARGIESLDAGEVAAARAWLEPLGDTPVVEGAVALEPASALLRARAAATPAPGAPAPSAPATDVPDGQDGPDGAPLRVAVLVSGPDVGEHLATVTEEVRRSGHLVVGWSAERAGDAVCDLVLAVLGWRISTGATGNVPWFTADLRAARAAGIAVDAFVPDPAHLAFVKLMDPSMQALREELGAVAPLRTFAAPAELRARVATSLRAAAQRPRVAGPVPVDPACVYVAFLADDALHAAARLSEALRQLGFETHLDGTDDDVHVQHALDEAAARSAKLLALIGPRTAWLAERSAGAPAGRLLPQARRVAQALRRPDRPVVPVLLDGTTMPRAEQLPTALAPLVERHALRLDAAHWEDDLHRLLQVVGAPPVRRPDVAVPKRALVLVDNRRHRDLFDLVADALQREGCAPEMPDGVFANARPLAMIVAALRRVDCLVIDLSLPDDWLIPWTDGAAAAGVPLVPVHDLGEPPRAAWAAHVQADAARRAWVAPTLDWRELRRAPQAAGSTLVGAVALVRARAEAVKATPPAPAPLPPREGLRIALCSTSTDLAAFRSAVREVAAAFGDEVLAPADDELRPLQRDLDAIDACDIAVFVVAWRYGYVPDDAAVNPDGLSVVELQYRRAVALERTRLILMVEDVADWPTDGYDRGASAEKIRRFRRDLGLDMATRAVRSVEQAREQLTGFLTVHTHRDITAPPTVRIRPRGHALVFVGHTLDAPDRAVPRFPPALEASAAAALRDAVAAELQRGAVTFAAASGSHGGDILFLEACAAAGIPTRIYLPEPDRRFVAQSVAPAGPSWVERYQTLARRSQVIVLADTDDAAIDVGSAHAAQRDRWRRNADAMLEAARQGGREPPCLVALWDGAPTESPGGPSYLLARADSLGLRRVVIDPAGLAAARVAARPADTALELVVGSVLLVADAAIEAPLRLATVRSLLLVQLAAEAAAGRDGGSGAGIEAWPPQFSGMGWQVEAVSTFGAEDPLDVAGDLRAHVLQLVGPRPEVGAIDAVIARIASLGRGASIDALDARFAADDSGCVRAAVGHVRRFDDGRVRLALAGVELRGEGAAGNPFAYRGPAGATRFVTLVATVDVRLLEGVASTVEDKVAAFFDRLVTPLGAWEPAPPAV